jgi:hypothetical protein
VRLTSRDRALGPGREIRRCVSLEHHGAADGSAQLARHWQDDELATVAHAGVTGNVGREATLDARGVWGWKATTSRAAARSPTLRRSSSRSFRELVQVVEIVADRAGALRRIRCSSKIREMRQAHSIPKLPWIGGVQLFGLALTGVASACGARTDIGLTSTGPDGGVTNSSPPLGTATETDTTTNASASSAIVSVTGACDSTSCTGCCGAAGQCLAGTAASACGSGGNACATCPSGTCSEGVCSKAILFGGFGAQLFDDTWTFDGTSWTQVSVSSPPSARAEAVMAALGNEVVLFGGATNMSPPYLNDTWTYDGTRWTPVSVSSPPPARYQAMVATLGSEVVLFGGDGDAANGADSLNDTWTFDGTSWTQVSVSSPPPARSHAAMATVGSEVVLFGGYDANGALSDTWTFDGSRWTQVSVSSPPPARYSAGMATLGHEVVLFGGNVGGTLLNDTWTFDGTSWTQVPVSSPPSGRDYAMKATLGNRVVLFGGTVNAGHSGDLNDTWTFDGTSWTQVSVSSPPPAREAAAMATLP